MIFTRDMIIMNFQTSYAIKAPQPNNNNVFVNSNHPTIGERQKKYSLLPMLRVMP